VADDVVAFRHRLAARRAAGQPFDDAWRAELARVPEPAAGEYPATAALEAFRSAWQRSYELEPPTAVDRAAARLAGALEDAAGRGAPRGPRHPGSELVA